MKKLIMIIILLGLVALAKKANAYGNSINVIEHQGIEQIELELNKEGE